MYPFVNVSNVTSPSTGFSIDQTMISFLAPLYISPAFGHGDNSCSSSSSADFPVSTAGCNQKISATPKTAAGPVRNRRQRHEFCKVCQKNITEEGKRSQGPRRHILQHHLGLPIFFCPMCPATSNYDKAHIRTHMNRIHTGFGGEVIEVEKRTFAKEEERWFKRCFGEGAESRSNFIIKEQEGMTPELKAREDVSQISICEEKPEKDPVVKVEENADDLQDCFGGVDSLQDAAGKKKIKKEHEIKVEEKDAHDFSSSTALILFSIEKILSGRTRNV